MDRLKLSARGVHRVLKVARTIADLAGDANIALPHLTEALAVREVAIDY
jgi:magnesium chelatase family protein